MSLKRLLTAPRAVFLLFGLSLSGLAFACGPTAAPSPTAVPADPFAVVRATSQAAYQSGKPLVDSGDIMRGCPLIDAAKTADPDNRPDIQAALDQCLTQIPQLLATSAAAPTATLTSSQRPIVVATLPPVAPAGQPATPPAAVMTPSSQPARPAGVAPPSPAAAAASLILFRDPQGRFTVAAPVDWVRIDSPQALFGSGIVQFRDRTAVAELDVAVDTVTKAVSPELYAASIELAMQQQVPGYATEQALPDSIDGNPAIRRVFTFTQRDASGRDIQARAFQVVVVKGQTPYVITASAPADQFQQFTPLLDQMAASFHFS
ncbi:MAG TPA: hypothetical protein VGQ62_05095 [Chloroflexota bacterium]|nr:hypothetical protein [Chloroflexota bacterium]